MTVGPIRVPRTAIVQPDRESTRKSQKRGPQGAEYNAVLINQELDYVHERLNLIVVEDPALTDLEAAATLADVIVRVNELTETLRSAGLLKPS